MTRILFTFLFIISGSLETSLHAKVFDLDKDHTSVGFKIRHILTHVRGNFKDFKGTFETDEKGALIKIEATVKATSIDTDNAKRDDHLRSADFFDVKKYSDLKFVSDKFKIKAGSSGKVPGQLTIHGVTKTVDLNVEYLGEANANGFTKAGATAAVKINRKDFGLTWNKALETGGVLVGEDVEIELEVEGNQKAIEKVAEVPAAEAKKNSKK